MTKCTSWIQHPLTGKLIPRDEYVRPDIRTHHIIGDIESFVSPITQEVITDRAQLRRHNAEHGVTDSRDYSTDFMKKRSDARENEMTGNTPKAKEERRQLLHRALDINGYTR